MSRCAYIPYFKINAPIFCCPLFFKEYLNPHVMINKMEHTVDYHHCPSELTSRIHLLMFLWAPKSFISPEGFFPQQNGGRIMELKKMTKIKLSSVLATSFDKFHHICNLYIFCFCFVVPWLRFKHAEACRFFNLTNKIFTKKYSVQE